MHKLHNNMKTTFIFIRHAQSMAPLQDIVQGRGLGIELSPEGETQAEALGERLKSATFDRIFASTARRAIDTASCIRKYHPDISYMELEKLNERSKGEAEGMTNTAFKETHPQIIEDWSKDIDVRPPGGESFGDVEGRVVPLIEEHLKEYEGQTILYVFHGNVIRVLLGHFLDVPINLRYRIKQSYCAYNKVAYDHDAKRWSVECMNCSVAS